MSRDRTRGLLFDHLQDRLEGRHRLRVADVVGLFARKEPSLWAVLEQAHDGGDRASVNWVLEGVAVDELGRLFDLFGVERQRLRRVGVVSLGG